MEYIFKKAVSKLLKYIISKKYYMSDLKTQIIELYIIKIYIISNDFLFKKKTQIIVLIIYIIKIYIISQKIIYI